MIKALHRIIFILSSVNFYNFLETALPVVFNSEFSFFKTGCQPRLDGPVYPVNITDNPHSATLPVLVPQ